MEKSCNICSLPAGNQSSHLSLIISPKKTGPKGSRGTGETGEAAGHREPISSIPGDKPKDFFNF